MKNVSKLAAIVSLGALLPLGSFARTVEQSYVESFKGASADMPVPLEVVSPISAAGSKGMVELTFTVDAQGKPTEIAVKSITGSVPTDGVKDAVSQWKFAPAKRNGEPVARKVLLPVRFVAAD